MTTWKLNVKKSSRGEVEQRRNAGDDGTLAEIRRRFDQMQMPFLKRPLGSSGKELNPKLPSDLTLLSDTRLGALFGEFCIMTQFAKQQLAAKRVQRAGAKVAEKYARAETRLRKEGSVPDKDAQVEVDRRVRSRAMEVLVTEGVETLTEAMLDAYIVGRDALSREMTRRFSTEERNVK